MDKAISVRVEDLRRALNLVLDEVEHRMGSVVDLAADYYWVPDRKAVYDVSTDARAPAMIGQLSDDVDTIAEIVAGDNERFIAIWHDLSHINGVLARLAALDTPGL